MNTKAALIILYFSTILAFTNAMPAEKSSDIADILRQLTSKTAFKEGQDNDFDYDDDLVANVMTSAMLSSILDGDESGDSILATMMEGNDNQAVVQLRFIKRLWGKIKKSKVGKFIGNRLRNRFCGKDQQKN